jgi:hypothetical protein
MPAGPSPWASRVLAGALGAFALCHARPAAAVEFTVRKVPVRLSITDSLFFGFHSLAEPLSTRLQGPYGDPLNPFSGLTFCAGDAACQRRYGFNNNRVPLTRGGAGQGYFDLFNRFNLQLSVWRIQAGLRVDTSVFINPPLQTDPRDPDSEGCGAACIDRFLNRPVTPTGLEKAYLIYAGRKLEVQLGDSYAVFGRGLVLSLRKVDELGIDTSILGAKIIYNPGRFKLIALGGVSNIQNTDEPTGRFQTDPFDLILGLRGEARLFDKILVGVHAAGGALRKISAGGYGHGRLAYGVTVEAPRLLPWLDLYVEGAGLQLFPDQPRESDRGYALYGSATIYAGDLTLLFEGKQYSHFDPWNRSASVGADYGLHPEFANIAYNQPATLERVLTELDPQVDVGGGRLLLTYRASPSLSLVMSNAFFRQGAYVEQAYGGHALHITDPYAGVQGRWQGGVSHLFVNGGYRWEHEFERDQVFQTIGWFDWDFTQALPKNLSLESQGRALFRKRVRVTPLDGSFYEDWSEGNAYVALKWAPYLIAALGLEWSTREITVNEAGETFARYAYFPNGSIQYNVTSRTSVRFFAGGQRGGLKCISGICRVFPDMRGARLEAVLRF